MDFFPSLLDKSEPHADARSKALGLTNTAEMAMAAGTIVKDFNVIKNISTCQVTGFVNTFANPFFFETAKKGLCYGISLTKLYA